MNRRSFFRYAVGGVCAAPLALVGENASAFPAPRKMAFVGGAGPGIDDRTYADLLASRDKHIQSLVDQRIQEAMRGYQQRPTPRRT